MKLVHVVGFIIKKSPLASQHAFISTVTELPWQPWFEPKTGLEPGAPRDVRLHCVLQMLSTLILRTAQVIDISPGYDIFLFLGPKF